MASEIKQEPCPSHTATRLSTGYGRSCKGCDAVTRVVVFGCLGMALFGYDTGVVSGAMLMVSRDLDLTTTQKELAVSMTMFCAALSTVVGIPMNSRFGRKAVIVLAALLYVAGSLFIAAAMSINELIVGRALLGVAIGFASGTVPMYSAELSPPSMRGMIVTLNDLNIVFGQLIASLANVIFQHTEGGWRWTMGLAAVPGLLLLLGCFMLPESPRWLTMKERHADAKVVLGMLMKDEEERDEALADIHRSLQREFGPDNRPGCCCQLMSIWKTPDIRRAAILGISLMAMNQFSGINTVMYYSSTILVGAGFSEHAALWLAAMCCLAQLLGVCVSVASMDSIGRRRTALRSCIGVIVTLIVLATSFSFEGHIWDDIKVIALMLYLVAFGSGLSGVPWVVNAEIYPLHVRSIAVGQATFMCWWFNWFVGRYFLSICEALGTSGAFLLCAGFSLIGSAWLYLKLPETMGLELESIRDLFCKRTEANIDQPRDMDGNADEVATA